MTLPLQRRLDQAARWDGPPETSLLPERPFLAVSYPSSAALILRSSSALSASGTLARACGSVLYNFPQFSGFGGLQAQTRPETRPGLAGLQASRTSPGSSLRCRLQRQPAALWSGKQALAAAGARPPLVTCLRLHLTHNVLARHAVRPPVARVLCMRPPGSAHIILHEPQDRSARACLCAPVRPAACTPAWPAPPRPAARAPRQSCRTSSVQPASCSRSRASFFRRSRSPLSTSCGGRQARGAVGWAVAGHRWANRPAGPPAWVARLLLRRLQPTCRRPHLDLHRLLHAEVPAHGLAAPPLNPLQKNTDEAGSGCQLKRWQAACN